MSAEKTQPWTRQPDETAVAFAAFVCYRDREDRSLSKVAEQLGKSTTLVARWSARHEWVERIRAYDIWQDDQLRLENLRGRRAMMRRISAEAQLMQTIALACLKKLGASPNLTPEETARYIDLGARLEMRSRGEPEDGDVAQVFINVDKREPEAYRADLCAPERGLGQLKETK